MKQARQDNAFKKAFKSTSTATLFLHMKHYSQEMSRWLYGGLNTASEFY